MPQILDSFRTYGLRFSPQRYAVLQYLTTHPSHPTAEEVHKALNRNNPKASLATVYKALHALAQSGLVREVNLSANVTRFECAGERHHHFVCERCTRIEGLPWFDVAGLAVKSKAAPRTVRTWELVLYGLCESCQSQPKERLRWRK